MPDHALPYPILDVRPCTEFDTGHINGAVNIPLETLNARISELPPPDEPLRIFDVDSDRADIALAILRRAKRPHVTAITDMERYFAGPLETGPSTNYLWRPHGLIARVLAEMRLAWGEQLEGKRAVDLACGVGRDAAALALGGLTVEGWDNLPEALQRADCLANACGAKVETRQVDLEAAGFTLPPGAFDVIACFHYLHRPLMAQIERAIRPGGFVVYETFTVAQREQIGKPRKDKHLLRPGELSSYFADWRIFWNAEGFSDGRWVASLIARKLGGSSELGEVTAEDRADAER